MGGSPSKPTTLREEPWRETIGWGESKRNDLIKEVVALRPETNLQIPSFNIVLAGLIGSGKSSFINSIIGVLRGGLHLAAAARTGNMATSLTREFTIYQIRRDLPFRICDTICLSINGRANNEVDIINIKKAVEGHVPNGYKFNDKEFQSDSPGYIADPKPADIAHCVAIVVNAQKVRTYRMEPDCEKLRSLAEWLYQKNIRFVVLLTHLDEFCEEVQEDVTTMFHSIAVEGLVRRISYMVHGLPENHIFPVINYTTQVKIDPNIDILLLYALRQMLGCSQVYIESLEKQYEETPTIVQNPKAAISDLKFSEQKKGKKEETKMEKIPDLLIKRCEQDNPGIRNAENEIIRRMDVCEKTWTQDLDDGQKPVLVFCVNASRIVIDIESALRGVSNHRPVMVVLHCRNPSSLKGDLFDDDWYLDQALRDRVTGIAHFAFSEFDGFYSCRQNDDGYRKLSDLLTEAVDKTINRPHQLGGVDTRSSLVAEQQAHEDTRYLLSEAESTIATLYKTLEDIQRTLAGEQRAHDGTLRRLATEQRAHEDTRSRFEAGQHAYEDTQSRLEAEQQAHEDTRSSLEAEQQAHEDTRSSLEAEQQDHEDTRSSLEVEQQAHEDTRSRLEAEQQAHEDTRSSFEVEQQAHEDTQSSLEAEQQAHEDTRSSLEVEQQAHEDTRSRLEAEQQAHEDTRSSLEAEQQAHEETRNDLREAESTITEESDWILARNDIEMSERIIGVGGWGSVVEGRFRGSVVAVKQIHELILSPLNRRLFGREMNIASRCRHPCLLKFIGATNDNGNPLFVTELLDTNLRAVLHERALEPDEIKTIALDVARALNYLHLNRPVPIIHRDISSANVLLWKHGESWRAKVSDYGTANFMHYSMTECPGAVIYSAPEAQTSRQSPKVDVYSYGVLLCEMNIRELPDPSERNQQVSRVTSQPLGDLIRRCLNENPEDRPSMEEIILSLEGQ